ncbi:MAG: hypothetical protein B5766_05980 [Candidatus Lumbricidophila eiseniae]|uniref:Uncharacterized protein n=1 Tax=Candidatus Lumbricidiphila eiseniae TaxID=1969409 RepID=A0A2A6FR68_9MICO|nr:MAG: hypothetical protein B5766_05980 [Candidatus Lumbricidophila eiseniae]
MSVIRSVFAGFYAGWVWERRVSALRPLLVFVLGWFGLGLVVLGAFVIVLNVLNHTLYGAPVFVQRYLSAIASDNITEAMSTPGVDIDATTLTSRGINGPVSRAMLRTGVLNTGPKKVTITTDTTHPDGRHSITATYTLAGTSHTTTFDVVPLDPLYGLINRWKFATSPLTVLDVTTNNTPFFTAGHLTLDARANKPDTLRAAFSQQTPYLTLAPAAYLLSYTSPLLTIPAVTTTTTPNHVTPVELVAQPTHDFIQRVQTKLDQFLTTCTQQQVLMPTQCPFGTQINDRIIGTPRWTITSTPQVTLTPGTDSFIMPPTTGIARISVDVQSLYDGTKKHLIKNHPFTIGLNAQIQPNNTITIQLQ